jgi:hypothetical protein
MKIDVITGPDGHALSKGDHLTTRRARENKKVWNGGKRWRR